MDNNFNYDNYLAGDYDKNSPVNKSHCHVDESNPFGNPKMKVGDRIEALHEGKIIEGEVIEYIYPRVTFKDESGKEYRCLDYQVLNVNGKTSL